MKNTKCEVSVCQYCVKRLDGWCYDYYHNPAACVKMMSEAAERRLAEGDGEAALRLYVAMYDRGDITGGVLALKLLRKVGNVPDEALAELAEDVRFKKKMGLRLTPWNTPLEWKEAKQKSKRARASARAMTEDERVAIANMQWKWAVEEYAKCVRGGVFGVMKHAPVNKVAKSMLSHDRLEDCQTTYYNKWS